MKGRKRDGPVGGNDGKGKGVGSIISRSGDATSESKTDSAPFKLSYLRHNELEYVNHLVPFSPSY